MMKPGIHLNGVYFEPSENNLVRMVATDGHRLSYIDREIFLNKPENLQKGIIIPKKGLIELKRMVEGGSTGNS